MTEMKAFIEKLDDVQFSDSKIAEKEEFPELKITYYLFKVIWQPNYLRRTVFRSMQVKKTSNLFLNCFNSCGEVLMLIFLP